MVVNCPACKSRFRLDQEKLRGKQVTLRCAKCRKPFKIEIPVAARQPSSAVQVVVAHSDPALCGTIRKIVEDAGMVCHVSLDGKNALQIMEQTRPQVAVVDVALQGLYAFEVVDKVRRRPGLDKVKIILLSSVYNRTAYKRSPSSLYDADDYIEKHHIPDDLILKINFLLTGAVPVSSNLVQSTDITAGQELDIQDASSQTLSFINKVNSEIQIAEANQLTGEADLSLQEKARRLARVIVADIALYNQEKIDEGIRRGNWAELLSKEVSEARRLFMERFPNEQIQKARILETTFIDLLEHRRQELED